MPPLEIIGMFAPIIIIFVIAYLLQQRRAVALQKILERQAVKRNGKIEPAEFLLLPTLVFPHQQLMVNVLSYPPRRHSTASTQIETQIPTADLRAFHISPEGVFTQIGKAITGEDVKIGNNQFDDSFLIKSNNEDFLREIIDAELQQELLNLKQFNLSLSLQEGTLNLTVPVKLNDEQMLERLLKVYLATLDKLLA